MDTFQIVEFVQPNHLNFGLNQSWCVSMWLHQNCVERYPADTAEVWTIVECMGHVGIPKRFVSTPSHEILIYVCQQVSFLDVLSKICWTQMERGFRLVLISFNCAESWMMYLWCWYLYRIGTCSGIEILMVLVFMWYWYCGIWILLAFTCWEWFQKMPVILPAARQLSCFPNISSNYNFNTFPQKN